MINHQVLDQLQERLGISGLRILHSGPPTEAWPARPHTIQSVLIIGHAGSEFWPHFRASEEYADGMPDPLDRWSRRVIQATAPDMAFVSPNDGPPYAPLHALSAGGSLFPSPLGMMAHGEFGLWTAVRGLLLSKDALPASPAADLPPASVFDQCFAACPVSAFSETGYDAVACAQHLIADPEVACWGGCLARKACTLGASHAYDPSHAKFYMDAFTAAMQRRGL